MKFSSFASQFNPSSGILQLMRDLGEGVNGENEVIMLGGGNPARIDAMEQVFRAEMTALMSRTGEFEQMVGNYDDPKGNRLFCEALASLLAARFNWSITAENIAVTNGSQASFGIIFNALSGSFDQGPDRRILLPVTPEYIGYADVGIGGSEIFTASQPLIEEHAEGHFKYRVDFDNLSIGDDVGAICVSRPTNPSGNVITDNELARLRTLAMDHDVPLIVDGAYGQPFPGIIFTETAPVWDSNIVLCLSLSKLGLPGVRAGIVIADIPLINLITGASAINTLSPGRFGPSLVQQLVVSGDIMKLSEEYVRPYYLRRSADAIAIVHEEMADIPVRIHESEGAIFLWLWFPDLPITSQVLYQRLKERGVFVIAGQHFFPGLVEDETSPWKHRHECIRVSYAAEESSVRRGMRVIAEEVKAAYRSEIAA